MAGKLMAVVMATVAALMLSAAAQGTNGSDHAPATLTVGEQGDGCPSPDFRHIQDAVDAAAAGDTIVICPGTYVEGAGMPNTTALKITKDLTLRGAGADQVTIEPKSVGEMRIAADAPNLRNGHGVIVAVFGAKSDPITVNISGVTVDANGVYATAGIVYIDAQGTISRSRVTGLDIDESANGYTVPGGFRSNQWGIGIAAVTRVEPLPNAKPKPIPVRTLTIDHTRVDR